MADASPDRLSVQRRSARPDPAIDAQFAAPEAVRRALVTWAAEAHLAPPSAAEAIRSGVALALALSALAGRMLGAAEPPWQRRVPTSRATLEAMTGITGRGLTATLEQLVEAGLARVASDSAGLLVTLDPAAWGAHPLLAAMPWEPVVAALTSVDAPVTASLVVLAELVALTEEQTRLTSPLVPGALPLPCAAGGAGAGSSAPLAVTCKALAGRTQYSLSRVDQALAGLERAGCVGRLVRRGSAGAIQVRPWVIGVGAPPAVRTNDPVDAPPPTSAPPTPTSPAGVHPQVAGTVVIEIGGVRALLAPGDTLDLTGRDADGRRVVRIDVDGVPIVIRPPAAG